MGGTLETSLLGPGPGEGYGANCSSPERRKKGKQLKKILFVSSDY